MSLVLGSHVFSDLTFQQVVSDISYRQAPIAPDFFMSNPGPSMPFDLALLRALLAACAAAVPVQALLAAPRAPHPSHA